jgi:hypothetical protein
LNTPFDLKKRILILGHNDPLGENDILVEFDGKSLTSESFLILQQLPQIIEDNGEEGTFELGIFKVSINSIIDYKKDLTTIKDPNYLY